MCIAALALVSLVPSPAGATQVRDLSLAQMAAAAGPVFSGRVIAVERDEVRGLPVTRVTFKVVDGIQNVHGDATTLTFLGGERAEGLPLKVLGTPTFKVGEQWVLLAYPPSEIGLTAPVGLYQGAFRVQSPAGGALREGAGFLVTLPGSRRALMKQMREDGLLVAPGPPPAMIDGVPAGNGLTRAGEAPRLPAAREGNLPAGATVPYGTIMRRLRELTGAAPSARAVQPEAATDTSLEAAAAAAARGNGRQP
jgi:hypothetical protein